MDTVHAQVLAAQFVAFVDLLNQRGLELPNLPSQEDFAKLEATEQNRWVRTLRDILRTPID